METNSIVLTVNSLIRPINVNGCLEPDLNCDGEIGTVETKHHLQKMKYLPSELRRAYELSYEEKVKVLDLKLEKALKAEDYQKYIQIYRIHKEMLDLNIDKGIVDSKIFKKIDMSEDQLKVVAEKFMKEHEVIADKIFDDASKKSVNIIDNFHMFKEYRIYSDKDRVMDIIELYVNAGEYYKKSSNVEKMKRAFSKAAEFYEIDIAGTQFSPPVGYGQVDHLTPYLYKTCIKLEYCYRQAGLMEKAGEMHNAIIGLAVLLNK